MGQKQMSIEFAPIRLPLKRRLQMVAILAYVILILFGGLLVVLTSIYVLLYTSYLRWCYIAYLTWVYTIDIKACDRGSRPIKWVRSWKWWLYMADYFPVNLVKLSWGELDPTNNYMFCCFPHGMVATGAFTALLTEARNVSKVFPHHTVHVNTLKSNFMIPILRELFLSMGAVSASADSLNYLLSDPNGGNITALVIGGAQEAFYSKPDHYKLVLKNRKGFVKIALRNGAPLVPVISFGEPDILSQVEFEQGSWFLNFQMAVKKYCGIVPIMPVGRGIFQYNYGILPRRREIDVVVGKPINVEKVEQPTQKQIDDLHKLFIEKLTELFETQKANYLKNCEDIHLEIL